MAEIGDVPAHAAHEIHLKTQIKESKATHMPNHKSLNPLVISLLVSTSILQSVVAGSDGSRSSEGSLQLHARHKIAFVGNCLAERMNLFGNFEARLHSRHPDKELIVRNFGWPADEVGNQQRPSSYTTIDDPLEVFSPELFFCFFGFNESFAGIEDVELQKFKTSYRNYIDRTRQKFSKNGAPPQFVLVSPVAFENTGILLQPDGVQYNQNLELYSAAIAELAREDGHLFIDLVRQIRNSLRPGTRKSIHNQRCASQ